MRQYIRSLTPLLLAFLSLAINSALAAPNNDAPEKRVVAKVNDRPIYFSQLQPVLATVQSKYKKFGADQLSDETRKRIQSEELERQIAFELLVQAGEKNFGKDIEQKVDEKVKAKSGKKTASANLNESTYRDQVRRQLLVDEFLAARLGNLKVPENELKQYYEQNTKRFMEPESVRVSHILVKTSPKMKPEEIAQARKEIEQIRAEIVSGKDFAEMARKHSTCASSKAGGDLGYIKHNYMPQEFDNVAFALKVNELSEIVKTRHGFHLIKSLDKKPERVPEFKELKDFIEKFLLKEVQKKKVDEVVAELRRDAKVELGELQETNVEVNGKPSAMNSYKKFEDWRRK